MPDKTADQVSAKWKSTEELGLPGLRVASGRINEEFLPKLTGNRWIEVLREMVNNDPIVGSILFAIDKLIRQVDWRVEQAEGADGAFGAKVFVEQCMDDMSMTWPDLISEILTMIPYGWSYFELVYKKRERKPTEMGGDFTSKYDDGYIGWKKWGIRSQDTLMKWEFDEEGGGLKGMWQSPPPHYKPIFIPIEKSLLFRTSAVKNNPEGRSVLRNAYRPWFFKKRIEEIEATGIDRDLAGMPVLYVDPTIMMADASAEKKAFYEQCKQLVINLRRDQQEGVIIPNSRDASGNQLYNLQLLSTGGSRQFDTSAIIQRYDQRIAMTVLADFILLGHEKVGSFALSSDKTDLFAVAIRAWLEAIKGVINTYALPRLWALNGFDPSVMPKIDYGDIETPPLADIGAYVTALVGAGVPLFPNKDLEDYLSDIGHLPRKPMSMEPPNFEAELEDEKGNGGVLPPSKTGAAPNTPMKNPEAEGAEGSPEEQHAEGD